MGEQEMDKILFVIKNMIVMYILFLAFSSDGFVI